jgi:hypothetical protein
LVTLAIAVGIFGVGFVLVVYSSQSREVDANIALTNPESATLHMDKADDGAVDIRIELY